MTIAVSTPTGNVGSHVVRMLCQAGARPRLLPRNPDRLDPGVRDHVELAVGDQRDADFVTEATRGVEAVFWAHRTTSRCLTLMPTRNVLTKAWPGRCGRTGSPGWCLYRRRGTPRHRLRRWPGPHRAASRRRA